MRFLIVAYLSDAATGVLRPITLRRRYCGRSLFEAVDGDVEWRAVAADGLETAGASLMFRSLKRSVRSTIASERSTSANGFTLGALLMLLVVVPVGRFHFQFLFRCSFLSKCTKSLLLSPTCDLPEFLDDFSRRVVAFFHGCCCCDCFFSSSTSYSLSRSPG